VSAISLSLCAAASSFAAEEKVTDSDEAMLKEAKIATDDAGLLAFLHKEAGKDDDLRKLEKLIRQLGSDDFSEREDASKRLLALRWAALPRLREALADKDAEVARRAKECVETLERSDDWWQLLPAIRLLVRHNPKSAVEALLHYLPYAPDDETREEIWYGLAKIGVDGGKPHPSLASALKDDFADRRAVAACLLGWRGDGDQRRAVRQLLNDESATVQLRAAQGLLAGKEACAIPVLIALLDDPSIELAWQAEELLAWVAGDDAAEATLGTRGEGRRKKCRAAWEAWWTARGKKLDFAKVFEDYRRPGLLLLCEQRPSDEGGFVGRAWVCGCNGKARWQLTGLGDPGDCQWLRGGRILLSEGDPPTVQVTERDLHGKVVWKYAVKAGSIDVCQRLPNGNTFLSNWSRGGLFEVASGGPKAYSYKPDTVARDLIRLRNGHILFVERIGRAEEGQWVFCELKGADTQEISTIRPKPRLRWPTSIAILPDGNILLVAIGLSRAISSSGPNAESGRLLQEGGEVSHNCLVMEMDRRGEARNVWRVPGALQAVPLRGGNTLVFSRLIDGTVLEIDRRGKVVAETWCSRYVACVRPILGLVRLGFDHPRPPDFDLSTSVSYRLKGLKSKGLSRNSLYA
jgi:HEAT repeat protein